MPGYVINVESRDASSIKQVWHVMADHPQAAEQAVLCHEDVVAKPQVVATLTQGSVDGLGLKDDAVEQWL